MGITTPRDVYWDVQWSKPDKNDLFNVLNENSNDSDNIVITNIRKINQNDIEYIENIKKSKLAEKYLNNHSDWYPKYKLEIDRWDKKCSRYLSGKILGSSHTYIVWYCKVWWELKARTFWRSNSEWCRRAWLWEEKGSNWGTVISKGQKLENATYETTTKVDYRVADKLDMISDVVDSNLRNHPHSSLPSTPWIKIWKILTDEMSKYVTIDKLFEDYPYSSSCELFTWKDIHKVINFYKNSERLKLNEFDLDNLEIKSNYTYKHKYLWIIDVFICRTTWNWKSIDIHFTRARNNSPEKFWVDNIIYSDAKINSFWTYDKQINASPLTAKPIEYIDQAPKDMDKWHQTFWDYVDIRDLYQQTPLIVKFKEKFLEK